jgi:dinuclear metal center YbgI/SA1388 family protein
VRRVTNDVQPATLGQVVDVLERMYDPSWARDWDAVGLVCGDPSAPVRRVLLAVDPVASVVDEAASWHADLVISHHPLLLRGVHGVPATTAKGRIVHRLIRMGCALYTAHTNADAAAPGVSDALARVLGLTDLEPLSGDPGNPVDKVVTFVPEEAVEAVVDAMSKAGAGHVGGYSRCAFTAAGTGTFVPGVSSASALGRAGERIDAVEQRVEMVLPRSLRGLVIAALRAVHPYSDPAVDVYELASWSSPRGIGRVGHLAAPTTLREFAMLVAEALPAAVQGVRIAGDPTAEVSRVAVCGGAGDSLLSAARTAGADVFVTSDLRHHLVSELREDAGDSGPFLVDVAHWASEWPWLAGVANRLEGVLEAAGTPVEVHVSQRSTDPWSFRVPSPGSVVR